MHNRKLFTLKLFSLIIDINILIFKTILKYKQYKLMVFFKDYLNINLLKLIKN